MSGVFTDRRLYRLIALAAALAALLLGSVGPCRLLPADALATLQLNPTASTAGSDVGVTGIGFARKSLVAVWADFRTRSGVRRSTVTAHSLATGSITARLKIPADAQPATYVVTASDFHGHRAGASLKVVAGVTLHVGLITPITTALAGSSFLVVGAGFAPGPVTVQTSFTMYLGRPISLARTVQAGAGGSFPALAIAVPYGARSGVVKATDSIGQMVIAEIVVQYRPAISVHPSPIPTGAAVQINGTGYVPGSAIAFTFIQRRTGRQVYSSQTTAGKAGRIAVWVHPGSSLRIGAYTLVATDTDGGFLARSTVLVTNRPSLSASPSAVAAGSRVVIQGFHFPRGTAVRVAATVPVRTGPTQTVISRATAGRSGNFRTPLRIPVNASSSGLVRVTAQSGKASAGLSVRLVPPPQRISVAPATSVAGESVTVAGAGFGAGDSVSVSASVTLTDGTKTDLAATASASQHGTFSATLDLPLDAAPGTYPVLARSKKTDKSSTASLIISAVSPSIVTLPRSAAPGTSLTVTGFGFPAGAPVQLSMPGGSGTATADSAGRFIGSLSVPLSTGPGTMSISAQSGATSATSSVAVTGAQTTHAYFPSLYTGVGYHEYIALLNPTQTDAAVTITYLLGGTTTIQVELTVPAHSRVTRDVNADLGAHASAAAVVTANGPIVAERLMRHHADVAVDSGATSPSPTWYFAWGNTSHGYREYLSVENPNRRPTEVAFLFMPAHGRQFTLFKTVDGSSRMTINVGAYVPDDAVSVKITSARAIVAGRRVFIDNGVSSKTGVAAAGKTWYFASGPRQAFAVNWIAVLDPGPAAAVVSVNAYGIHGGLLASVRRQVGAFTQEAFPIGKLAQHTDVTVVVTSTAPVVAEQTTYVGSKHDDTTDAFGVTTPTQTVAFAVMGTRTALSEADVLDVFNPSSRPAAMVVQLMAATGTTTQQSLIVAPHARETVNLGSLMTNVQLGAVLASSVPVVVMNRYSTDKGAAGDTSTGIEGSSD